MDYDSAHYSSPSLKQKIRSFLCFSCCFRGDPDDAPAAASLLRSSSTWVRTKAPEVADRCRSLASRIGKQRRHSVDFRYDPLDYALNFDDGPEAREGDHAGDAFKYRSFSSRLPASPPVTFAVAYK